MGVFFALITALFFGISNVYNRRAAHNVTSLQAMALNLGLSMLLFLPLGLIVQVSTGTPWPDWRAMGLFSLVGLIGLWLTRWSLFNTIALLGPSRASAIKNTAPLFSVLLALLVYARWPAIWPLFGIGSILAGIGLLGYEKTSQPVGLQSQPGRRQSLWGLGMVLGVSSALAFALGDLLRALAVASFPDPFMATALTFAFAWLGQALWLAARGQFLEVHGRLRSALDRDLVLAVLWSGVGQITSFVAIRLLFLPYATALTATAPLFTALSSHLLIRHDERLGPQFWLAALLLVLGAAAIALFQ